MIGDELSLHILALGLNVDDERRTHSNLALHFNVSSHLLDNLFTDAQTEACPTFVPVSVFSQFSEVDKQILLTLL